LSIFDQFGKFLRLDKTIDTEHDETSNDSGTVTYGGYTDQFNNDYTSELIGRAGMLRFHKMALGEAMAGTMLRGVKNPIKSVNWQFKEIPDATPEEEKVLEFLNWYWFKKYPSFNALMNQILTMFDFGHSVFERLWTPVKYEKSTLLVPLLEQRLQTSIEYLRSRARYIEFINAQGTIKNIPFDQLVMFQLDQTGEDLRGKSILREAYKSYKHKTIYQELMGIGMQRNAAGVPFATVPKGTKSTSKEYKALKTLLKNWISHEKAFGIVENNIEIKMLENNFEPDKTIKVIQYLDQQMVTSILMQFVLLGQGGKGGAFALGRDQSDMFLDGLQFAAELIGEGMTKQAIQPMVALNFANVDASKFELVGLDLNKKANVAFMEIVTKLFESDAVKKTINDEILLRKLYKLPTLSPEELKKREEDAENDINDDETDNLNKDPKNAKENKDDKSKGISKAHKDGCTGDDCSCGAGASKDIKIMAVSDGTGAESTKRLKFLKDNDASMLFFMQEQLTITGAKLQADIRKVLESGTVELAGLRKIELTNVNKFNAGLRRKMSGIADVGWNTAAKKAKRNNVKLSVAPDKKVSDLKDNDLKAFIINQSDQVTDDLTTGLKSKAIFRAQSSIMKGFSVDQAMARVEEDVDNYIASSPKVTVGSDAAVTSSLNFGQNTFNNSISEELWGFTFINEDPVTDICNWYEGKTFSAGSSELNGATPMLHPRCKSWLDPIYKASSKDKPEIDNVTAPPSIQKTATF